MIKVEKKEDYFLKAKKVSPYDLFFFILAILLATLFIYPVYFSTISAFKTQGEIMRNPVGLPSALRIDNFVYLVIKKYKPL